ncbi:MAG: hypothetical protein IPL70_06965 [Uliginosibacterium sp.]|nr:hypothetical protein [Uliginosibacterium sp.]
MKTTIQSRHTRLTIACAATLAAFMLSGCGGGGGSSETGVEASAGEGSVQFEIAAEEATLTLVDDGTMPRTGG